MFWDKKGPKTMKGAINKALTGDGRKDPMKEIYRGVDEILFGDTKKSKTKKCSKRKKR